MKLTVRHIFCWTYALLLGMLPLAAHAGAYEEFFSAVQTDNANAITSLLQRGLDPNLIDEATRDPALILAVREGAMHALEVLVSARGINLDAQAPNGDTALMIAAFKGNAKAAAMLIGRGATINRAGWTALHYAAASGSNDIVQMLIDKRANLNARSPNKTTPMMMAAYSGNIWTVKLLMDSGADATLKNDAGMTAIDFANQYGHKDIAEGLTYRLKKAGKL